MSDWTTAAIFPRSSCPSVKLARNISRESWRISLLIFIRLVGAPPPPANDADRPGSKSSPSPSMLSRRPDARLHVLTIPSCVHVRVLQLHGLCQRSAPPRRLPPAVSVPTNAPRSPAPHRSSVGRRHWPSRQFPDNASPPRPVLS